MTILNELKYSGNHEWVRLEGNRAYIGITDHAQHALGDIVYLEAPEQDAQLSAGDILGVVESVKSASDVYCPVSGIVVEINEELLDSPQQINQQPYDSWIAVIELTNTEELDTLMDADEYQSFCEEEV